ncbi:MAG: hypothetical protein ACYSSI_03980 [Planctomycetota bacterium]|jgi:hypothetical protein
MVELNSKIASIIVSMFLCNEVLLASPVSLQIETLRIPMIGSKRTNTTVVKSIVYPTTGKKAQMTLGKIEVATILSVFKAYSGVVKQFTLALIPTLILTEEEKSEIVKAAKEEEISLTIVQLEIGEKGKLTDTLFVFSMNQMGEQEKVLGELEIMPLPIADSDSIKGHLIYSDIIDVTKIMESQQDRLSAMAMLSQGDLKILNYFTLGVLSSYYSHTIDFLIEAIDKLGTTGNPNVLDTLVHLQTVAFDCLDNNCSPREENLKKVFTQNIKNLTFSLEHSIEMVKKQHIDVDRAMQESQKQL